MLFDREDICGAMFEEDGEVVTCILPRHSSPGHCSLNYDSYADEEEYTADADDVWEHNRWTPEYV